MSPNANFVACCTRLRKAQIARRRAKQAAPSMARTPTVKISDLLEEAIRLLERIDAPHISEAALSLTPELVAALPAGCESEVLFLSDFEMIRPWCDADFLILCQSRGLRLAPRIRDLIATPALVDAAVAAASECSLKTEITHFPASLLHATPCDVVARILETQVRCFRDDMHTAAVSFILQEDMSSLLALVLAGLDPAHPDIHSFATDPIARILSQLTSAHGRMQLVRIGPLATFLADRKARTDLLRSRLAA